jgi:hypothetical protein
MARNSDRWKRSRIDRPCRQRTATNGEGGLGISEAERDDLASSDFSLFGNVKHLLKDTNSEAGMITMQKSAGLIELSLESHINTPTKKLSLFGHPCDL